MGTTAEIRLSSSDEGLLDAAQNRVLDLERRWSRFLDDSEISHVNRSGGSPTIVSGETVRLLSLAVEAHGRTDGLFDPRILEGLVAAGYDRSHELLDADRQSIESGIGSEPAPVRSTPDLEVSLDVATRSVMLGANDRWDLGGIGKGFACDVIVEELWARGAESVLVNLGGDMRMHGPAFGEPAWTVDIDDPWCPGRRVGRAHLTEGAVATSSRARRRWLHEGRRSHHLIDPRTDSPAETDLVAVTVVATATWWAEVLAKTALIAGRRNGLAMIERSGCSALLVGADGICTAVGDHIEESGRG